MRIGTSVLQGIEAISEWSGKVASFIIIPNILALVYEVFSRYVLKSPTTWSYEVTYMFYAAHFLIGSAYTLKCHRHVRVDAIYSHLPLRVQGTIDAVCYLVLYFPVMIILIYGGVDCAREAFVLNLKSTATAWQPILWPFRALLPVGFLLLFLQGIPELTHSIKVVVRGEIK